MISIVSLVLGLLSSALAAAKENGVAQEITAGIEDAMAALTKVQGTPVTYDQLESLRVQPKW